MNRAQRPCVLYYHNLYCRVSLQRNRMGIPSLVLATDVAQREQLRQSVFFFGNYQL